MFNALIETLRERLHISQKAILGLFPVLYLLAFLTDWDQVIYTLAQWNWCPRNGGQCAKAQSVEASRVYMMREKII